MKQELKQIGGKKQLTTYSGQEANKFTIARNTGPTIRECDPSDLVKAIKVINIKFGGSEITDTECAFISQDLVETKGYVSIPELRLAVSTAIAGNLPNLKNEDLKTYGPISFRFLASVINAYQEWLSNKNLIQPVQTEDDKKERTPEQKEQDRLNFINETVYGVFKDTLTPKESIYTKTEKRSFYGLVFGFLEKEGITVCSNERKKEILQELRMDEISKAAKYYQNGQKMDFKRFCEPTFMEKPNKEKKRNPIYNSLIGDAKELLLIDFIRECDLEERDVIKELLEN